ncbi:zinc transporter ZupT [Brevibacterium litoralis]|uniref:zinc transporter ZupT n=1 Tax=Brevibacterium litoralis TaxID=3138935 RepID=UPI0032EB179D
MTPVVLAFLLTLIAGLATGLGGLIAVAVKGPATHLLAGALGLSAGVMVYVSFVEMLPVGAEMLQEGGRGERAAMALAVTGFFGGMVVTALIDRLVPVAVPRTPQNSVAGSRAPSDAALLRMGIVTAGALALHNFPEGFAVFLTGLQDVAIAIPVVVAIAVHNVPEGIAVAVPITQATGSRRRGLAVSFLAGLAEPAGALIGYLVLRPFITPDVLGINLAAVGGIMVFISFHQLLPAAHRYGHHRWTLGGLLLGMALMAGSLLVL